MNLSEEEQNEVLKVMESQMLTLLHGEFVKKFEEEFARYIGVKHAIAVNTGTAALHIAIAALDIGPGDEVIVPPFTFIATASSILHNNAIPIFADIDDKSYTLDPDSVKEKITDKTKAIIPVHLAGISADMNALIDIANDNEIFIENVCEWLLDTSLIELDIFGPSITNVTVSPNPPIGGQLLNISAEITDSAGIDNATLYYQINSEPEQSINMSSAGSTFFAEIPMNQIINGSEITFYIKAYDSLGNWKKTLPENLTVPGSPPLPPFNPTLLIIIVGGVIIVVIAIVIVYYFIRKR